MQDKYCIKVRKDPSATEGENSPFKEIDGLLHLHTEGALDDNYLMIVPTPYQKLIMTCLHNTITGYMGIARSVSSVMKHHFGARHLLYGATNMPHMPRMPICKGSAKYVYGIE